MHTKHSSITLSIYIHIAALKRQKMKHECIKEKVLYVHIDTLNKGQVFIKETIAYSQHGEMPCNKWHVKV